MYTNRFVRAGEELLWNYKPTVCEPYVEFDTGAPPLYQTMLASIRPPSTTTPGHEVSSFCPISSTKRTASHVAAFGGAAAVCGPNPHIVNAPVIKPKQVKRNEVSGTPSTVPRANKAAASAAQRKEPAKKRFVPDENPYGNREQGLQGNSNHVGEHSDDLDDSEDGSSSSSESVDSEVPDDYVNEPQPVYPQCAFPIVDV
jgi:hypothetical protein